jgi:uncharacterized protein involved in exopolysaccharide biosynthesis
MTDAGAPEGMTFARWLARVIESWRLVARVTGATVVLAIIAMIVLPPSYRAHVSFLAVSTSRSNVPSQYAGVAAQFGLMGQLADPGTTPPFYASLVVSRSFLTDLATTRYANPKRRDTTGAGDSVTLVPLLYPHIQDPGKALDRSVRALANILHVTPDARTNIVAITFDSRWPTLARDVANRAVALVAAFNIEKRQSRARAEREFLGARLREAESDLRDAEDSALTFYEQNRSWQQSPSGTVNEARRRRAVTVANEVYITLRREYESARVEEVNDQPVITVVDPAIAPVRKEWPRPIPVLAAAIIVGLMLGVCAAGTRALFRDWVARNPDAAVDLAVALGRVRGGRVGTRGAPPRINTPASGVSLRPPSLPP